VKIFSLRAANSAVSAGMGVDWVEGSVSEYATVQSIRLGLSFSEILNVCCLTAQFSRKDWREKLF